MLNRDLPNWEGLDGVGPDRAENLQDDIGTTEDFLKVCQELHPNLPPVACLDMITLKSVDGIGEELVSQIVDQLIEYMKDE